MSKMFDKIARNSLFNFLGTVWGAAISFFLTPYVVHRLGNQHYGLLALVGTIVGYAGLFDLSMDGTFAKHFSEYNAKGDYASLNKVISCGMAFYAVFAAFFIGFVVFTIDPLLGFLNIPPALHDEARFALIFGSCMFGFNSVGGTFEGLVYGLQRMDLISKVNMGTTLPNVAATVFVLTKGWGIRGLLWVRGLTRAVTFAAYRRFCRVLLPEIKPSLKHLDREMFGRLIRFGMKLHIGHIASTITAETDKLFITMFLSVGLVTDFQVGNALVTYGLTVASMVGVTLLPAFSELAAHGDHKLVTEAYLKGSRFMCAFTAPIYAFIAVSGGQLVRLWMGSGFEDASFLIKVLAIGSFTEAATMAGYSASIAISRPGILAKRAVVVAIVNIALNFALIKSFGFVGAGLGTTIALASGNLYLHASLGRELEIEPGLLRRSVTPFILLALVSAAAASFFDHAGAWASMNRLPLAGFIAAKGILFCAVYGLGTAVFGVFTPEEIGFVKEKLRARFSA